MRVQSLIVGSLAALIAPACASSGSVEDDLAGEADLAEGDDKADAGGTSTYYQLTADGRECVFPACGGFFLDRLNATTTTCHDGRKFESCYVPELDWSRSGLSEAQQQALLARSGGFDGEVEAIVRGRFAPTNSTTSSPAMGRFVITEAWVAQGSVAADGVFVKVKDAGLRCAVAPCPSIEEKALNSSRASNISKIDWSAGGYDEDTVSAMMEDVFTDGGLIIAGERIGYSLSGRSGKGRTATQAFRNVANIASSAPECRKTGCSGDVCADRDVFTTCEVRPDSVCYDTARCERQPDGDCGWTETPALTACLASH